MFVRRDIARTSLEFFLQSLTLFSPSGDFDFEFPETFWTVLERHSLFMISRDVSPAKHSPARAHISLSINLQSGYPDGKRRSREEKWRDMRVVSHASVTHTGTNCYLNDASWRKTCSRGDFNIATSLSFRLLERCRLDSFLTRIPSFEDVIAISNTRVR